MKKTKNINYPLYYFLQVVVVGTLSVSRVINHFIYVTASFVLGFLDLWTPDSCCRVNSYLVRRTCHSVDKVCCSHVSVGPPWRIRGSNARGLTGLHLRIRIRTTSFKPSNMNPANKQTNKCGSFVQLFVFVVTTKLPNHFLNKGLKNFFF